MGGSQKVTIREADEADVAYALAHLAGFPKGTFIGRINNIYHRELSKDCVVVFHKTTLDKAGFDHPMLLGPDIVITRVNRYSTESGKWEPTDDYLIDFSPKVDAGLVGKIEEEIRLAYSGARV